MRTPGMARIKFNGEEQHWQSNDMQDYMSSTMNLGAVNYLRGISAGNHLSTESSHVVQDHSSGLSSPSLIAELTDPVILPQFHSNDRSKGFMRAYSPVLQSYGIPQTMFLEFLEAFHQSIHTEPRVNCLNFAKIGRLSGSNIALLLINLLKQLSSHEAKSLEEERNQNTFLDNANDRFFRPHSLYCFVMNYDPNSNSIQELVDFSEATNLATYPDPNAPRKQKATCSPRNNKTELLSTARLVLHPLDKIRRYDYENAKSNSSRGKQIGKAVDDHWNSRTRLKHQRGVSTDFTSSIEPAKRVYTGKHTNRTRPPGKGIFRSLVTGQEVILPNMTRGESTNSTSSNREELEARRAFGELVDRTITVPRYETQQYERGLEEERRYKAEAEADADAELKILQFMEFGCGRCTRDIQWAGKSEHALFENLEREGTIPYKSMPDMGRRTVDHGKLGFRNKEPSEAKTGITSSPSGNKTLIQNGMLYLVIVSMPTDEELAAAQDRLKETQMAAW